MLVRNRSLRIPHVFSCNFLYACAMPRGACLYVRPQDNIVSVFMTYPLTFSTIRHLDSVPMVASKWMFKLIFIHV